MAGATVLQVARRVERIFQLHLAGGEEAEERAIAIAELDVSQALTVVSGPVPDVSKIVFDARDALDASATRKPAALERHWQNARTLSSRKPRLHKDRIVGRFAVEETLPSTNGASASPGDERPRSRSAPSRACCHAAREWFVRRGLRSDRGRACLVRRPGSGDGGLTRLQQTDQALSFSKPSSSSARAKPAGEGAGSRVAGAGRLAT
ncbi:hypothetical protein [Aureimonas sp. AU20]|uniref:hypothetical protein n=1 Tax=Aureimonas sp. AU20 TaxID=1349819 RepID=UPI000722EBA2|nr:hypothetical protein [Aureimonas sp. AU20]ALN75355.1 thermophilic desulfurizing enzyme [Aureimonas sp. AU20]